MTKTFRSSPLEIKLGEPLPNGNAAIPERVMVIRCGSFTHPQYGTFEVTQDMLRSIKKNFDANVRGIDLAMDYAHESDKVAAGWFKAIELSDDDTICWGIMSWTPKGQRVLSDKEFRYVSADFMFDYQNNETRESYGPTLLGAGLTNRPVIKGMDPVVELSEQGKGKPLMTPEQIKEMQDKLAALEAQTKKQGEELTAAQSALKAATEQSQALLAEKSKTEKEAKFNVLLSEGKLVSAQKEAFMTGDAVKLAELAQPVKLAEIGHGQAPNKTAEGAEQNEKSAQDQIRDLAKVLLSEKKATDLGKAIKLALSENAELAKKYREETTPA